MPLALERVEHPGAILPWRLMSQVLRMAAGQIGYPVAVVVLVKAQQPCDPSVSGAVAFGGHGG